MKKIKSLLIFTLFLLVGFVPAYAAPQTLSEYYSENGRSLPSISERSNFFYEIFGKSVVYSGTAIQNNRLLKYFNSNKLGEVVLGGAIGSSSLPLVLSDFEDSLYSKLSETSTSTLYLVRGTDGEGNALNGYYGLTVDTGSSNQEYVIAYCVGATCTQLKRGISLVNGQSTVLANRSEHRRGAVVSITDHPNLSIITQILNGNQATPGGLTFGENTITGITSLDGITSISGLNTPLSSDLTNVANVEYVNNITVSGAPDATAGVKGNVQLATTTSSSTIGKKLGSTGARLVLPSEMASSTQSAKVMIPVTNSGGKVDASFIDLETESGLVVSSTKLQIDIKDNGLLALDSGGISWDIENYYPMFGDGRDGDVTISSSTHLTEDKYYNNLTIDSGKVLITNGYKIFVKGTLTNNGTIQWNGNNGEIGDGVSVGTGGLGGAALPYGTLRGGTAGSGGGNRGSSVGVTGVSTTSATGIAGAAGGSGNGGGAGGAAGSAKIETLKFYFGSYFNLVLSAETALSRVSDTVYGTTSLSFLSSSAGSGGGGGGLTLSGNGGSGGGAGGSGGVILIQAKTLTNNGTIQANGGTGGNGGPATACGSSGTGGGGGAGGSGGLVTLIYKTLTLGTVNVAGGSPGTAGASCGGAGASANGTIGVTGKIIRAIIN